MSYVSIASNLEQVRNEIADACARAHRFPDDVALMAVSKMHPAEALLEAHAAGQRLFGENRVQEWQSKSLEVAAHLCSASSKDTDVTTVYSLLSPVCTSHLIGPLQNNKTTRAAELFSAIDTLDSLKTAERLNTAASALNKILPVLIEVKLSHEKTKHGLSPADLSALLEALAPLKHLRVDGLMTVPPFTANPELARPYFQQLRRLRDENISRFSTLTQLSMGMSNDFRVAIEEGSTCVRIGTAIFGSRT